MSDIYRKILDIFREQMGESDDFEIDLNATFDDLDIDSLDLLEIVTGIEDAFQISIPDDAMNLIKTAGDAIDYVEKLVQKG